MRAFAGFFAVAMLVGASIAHAGAPRTSPRPVPRDPRELAVPPKPVVRVYYRAKIRPRPRDSAAVVAPAYDLATTVPVFRSPRPPVRPSIRVTTAQRKVPRTVNGNPVFLPPPMAISEIAPVCGDSAIQGEVLAPIIGKLPGCGVARPVRISQIDGVVLSHKSIMDCQTARTLRGWISNSLKPALQSRGGGVKSLSIPSGYACRTRNSQPGAKISEHGKGRAIDISAFNLRDGSRISVKDGWKRWRDRRVLRRLHDTACGPFGTVLGPDANRFHRDHFHFDTARYRGGPYCR